MKRRKKLPYLWLTEQGNFLRSGKGVGPQRKILLDVVKLPREKYEKQIFLYVGGGNSLYALDVITGKLLWKYETGGYVYSSPVVYDGIVFFGSNDGYLYALASNTGKLLWKYKTGGKVGSSPVVYDGIVFFGSHDNHLYALASNTGKLLWRYETGNYVHSSPVVYDGIVFFGSHDNHMRVLSKDRCDVFSNLFKASILIQIPT